METTADIAVARIVSGRLEVRTRCAEMVDLNPPLIAWVRKIGAGRGVVTAFVRHTTASLTIQENADPDVQADLLTSLDGLAPANARYRHNDEGADDMPGHIKAMLCGASVTIPCDGVLLFGMWQSLYLVEHRAAGRVREVVLTYCGS